MGCEPYNVIHRLLDGSKIKSCRGNELDNDQEVDNVPLGTPE